MVINLLCFCYIFYKSKSHCHHFEVFHASSVFHHKLCHNFISDIEKMGVNVLGVPSTIIKKVGGRMSLGCFKHVFKNVGDACP
jgi:acetylglutamate synthase